MVLHGYPKKTGSLHHLPRRERDLSTDAQGDRECAGFAWDGT